MAITKERSEAALQLANQIIDLIDKAEPESLLEESLAAIEIVKSLLPLRGMRGQNFSY